MIEQRITAGKKTIPLGTRRDKHFMAGNLNHFTIIHHESQRIILQTKQVTSEHRETH